MKTVFAGVVGSLALAALLLQTGGCASAPGLQSAVPPAATQRLVSEDDHVRIQELRVRGQTQRLTVQQKDSAAPDYDILPPATGQDLSKARGATGQRVWSVLSF